MIEHFAARLSEYLITNVTKWSADAILYQLIPILKLMDHEGCLNWTETEKSIRHTMMELTADAKEGLFSNKSIGMIWQKFRPIRLLAKGKKIEVYQLIISSILEPAMMADMMDQFMVNLNSHGRDWLKQKQAGATMKFDDYSISKIDGSGIPTNTTPASYHPECEPRTPKRFQTTDQWFEIQLGEYTCRFCLKWRVNSKLLLVEFMGAYIFLATFVDNHLPGNNQIKRITG